MARMANLRRLVVDGLVTLALGYIIKKSILPLFGKLTENALLGWLDEKIGDVLGITGQTAFDWIVAFGLAAFILYLYHILQVFFFQKPAVATHTPGNPLNQLRFNKLPMSHSIQKHCRPQYQRLLRHPNSKKKI